MTSARLTLVKRVLHVTLGYGRTRAGERAPGPDEGSGSAACPDLGPRRPLATQSAAEAHRQSELVAAADRACDDMAFVEAVSDDWDE